MPPEWTVAQQVMDTIWMPLGLHGVNHYAYGKAVAPHQYAARSDPSSPLYQAWFGVYTVVGDSALRLMRGKSDPLSSVMKLAEYDQKAWLGAMGDPHPVATAGPVLRTVSLMIDGAPRTVSVFQMRSNSDLNSGKAPLAQYIGMPPVSARQGLADYHAISLHGYYAFWYDAQRRATIIVYAVSSSFASAGANGAHKDNAAAIDPQFRDMLGGVRIVDAGPSR